MEDTVVKIVEHYREFKEEPIFTHGGKRYRYCWVKNEGRVNIGVYCLDEDLCYEYHGFRKYVLGIDV